MGVGRRRVRRHDLILTVGLALAITLGLFALGARPGKDQKIDQTPSSSPRASADPNQVVRASVVPTCAGPGQTVRLEVEGPPHSRAAFAVVYADGQLQRNQKEHTLDDSGQASIPWKIPPEAPHGTAEVLVAVATTQEAQQAKATLKIDATCP